MRDQFNDFFERFLITFAEGKWQNDLEQAKQEFYGSLGTGLDDPQGYESQVDLFFSWYLLNRPLEELGKTPIVALSEELVPMKIESTDSQYIQGLAQHDKSLFEVLKIKDQKVYLRDLFTGEKRKVVCFDSLVGFHKGQYLSTWIWPLEDQYYFAKGYCFHPEDPKRFLQKEVKALRKTYGKEKGPEFGAFFLAILRMKLKTDKYHHLRPSDIYTFSDKVKL